MKSIVAIMAMAATAVTLAVDCTRTTTTPTRVAPAQGGVYSLKMNLTTTKGVAAQLQAGNTIVSGGVCARTTTTNNAVACVYRTKDCLTIDGYIVECSNTCKVVENSKVVYAWSTSRRTIIQQPKIAWTWINIMGLRNTEAEAFGNFTGTLKYNAKQTQKFNNLYLAGQGTFNGAYYVALCGGAAGTMSASYDLNPRIADDTIACAPSKVWDCGTYDATSTVCAKGSAKDTAVWGTWSIKYNASASARYFKYGILAVPAWAEQQYTDAGITVK